MSTLFGSGSGEYKFSGILIVYKDFWVLCLKLGNPFKINGKQQPLNHHYIGNHTIYSKLKNPLNQNLVIRNIITLGAGL